MVCSRISSWWRSKISANGACNFAHWHVDRPVPSTSYLRFDDRYYHRNITQAVRSVELQHDAFIYILIFTTSNEAVRRNRTAATLSPDLSKTECALSVDAHRLQQCEQQHPRPGMPTNIGSFNLPAVGSEEDNGGLTCIGCDLQHREKAASVCLTGTRAYDTQFETDNSVQLRARKWVSSHSSRDHSRHSRLSHREGDGLAQVPSPPSISTASELCSCECDGTEAKTIHQHCLWAVFNRVFQHR